MKQQLLQGVTIVGQLHAENTQPLTLAFAHLQEVEVCHS